MSFPYNWEFRGHPVGGNSTGVPSSSAGANANLGPSLSSGDPSGAFLGQGGFRNLFDGPFDSNAPGSGLGGDFLSGNGGSGNPFFALNQDLEHGHNDWLPQSGMGLTGHSAMSMGGNSTGPENLAGQDPHVFPSHYGFPNLSGSNSTMHGNREMSRLIDTIPSIMHSTDSDTSAYEGTQSFSSSCSSSDIGFTAHMEQAINNPEIRKKIRIFFSQMSAPPEVKLDVEGLDSNKQLDADDLRMLIISLVKVGNVQVTMISPHSALMQFSTTDEAYLVFILLDGVTLEELGITFRVSWPDRLVQERVAQIASYVRNRSVPHCDISGNPSNGEMLDISSGDRTISPLSSGSSGIGSDSRHKTGSSSGSSSSLRGTGSEGGHSKKFTCRYDVQIENEEKFQVARKVIGSKGINMKRIIEGCLSDARASKLSHEEKKDLVKLRLRGRGSGFKEGPHKKESDEALHLCVSAKYEEMYHHACGLTETLLLDIYKEYGKFVASEGKPQLNLSISKSETVPNRPLKLGDRSLNSSTANSSMSSGSGNNSMNSDTGNGIEVQSFQQRSRGGQYHALQKRPHSNSSSGSNRSHRKKNPKGANHNDGSSGGGSSSGGSSGKKFDINDYNKKKELSEDDVNALIEARNNARRVSDFAEADQIRDLLSAKNIALMDQKGGRGKGNEVTKWSRKGQ